MTRRPLTEEAVRVPPALSTTAPLLQLSMTSPGRKTRMLANLLHVRTRPDSLLQSGAVVVLVKSWHHWCDDGPQHVRRPLAM